MNDTSYLLDFFNKQKPCPAGIDNCETLREQYLQELEDSKAGSQCNGCFMRVIRDKYLEIMLKSK